MDFADLRKIVRLFLLALVVSAAFAQNAPGPQRTIRVVVDNDYVPFAFRSEEGELQGILVDQWREWEKRTGVRAELHAMDWNQALEEMRAGKFDVIDTIVQTPARDVYFDFTPPYETVKGAIFFRHDISGITDLASLKGFPVGVKAGDQHIDGLRASGISTVISFRNYNEIIEAAKHRQINVFVADEPAALYLLNKNAIQREFRRSAPVFSDQLRRAVRKGDAETLRLVSNGFAAIPPHELESIHHKWFGRPVNTYSRYLGYVIYVAAAALLLILGLFAWNRMLGRKIMARTAALAESEQRFRQIAENIREIFWLVGIDPRKALYASPAYETVLGRSQETLYREPQSFFAAVHPDDRERVMDAMETNRERGFEVEYRIVRPDASIRWIRDRGFPIKDDAGRIYRLAGIAEDITERKLAADALKQAEDRLRRVIDTIPCMVWCMRPDGRLEFVNQPWLDYTGIPFEQVLNDPSAPLHPDDHERITACWKFSQENETSFEEEMRLRRADGEYRWFLVRTVPLRNEHGTIVNWYGTSTDIEDRKRAEETIAQRERQFADAQHIAHVGSWTWDLRAGKGSWSDESCRIFGAEPGDPRLHEIASAMVHPDDRAAVSNAWRRTTKEHEPYEIEYRIRRSDVGERVVHSRATIERDENGVPVALLGTIQDVTDLRRAENELKATSEQLRALSASVQSAREEEGIRIAREIHDELGGTLTSLRWDLETVRKTISEPGKTLPSCELREKLTEMLGVTDTMIHIVRRIASDLRPAVLDVLGLEEALEWQARQFENRTGIAVHYESATDVELDPAQSTAVFRIFQEALTNVLRHARATRVDVTVAEDTGAFVLKVGDNGRGITDSERLGEQSIGLLGMRERAHLIGGEIDVVGIEGERTTVTLRLPLSA